MPEPTVVLHFVASKVLNPEEYAPQDGFIFPTWDEHQQMFLKPPQWGAYGPILSGFVWFQLGQLNDEMGIVIKQWSLNNTASC